MNLKTLYPHALQGEKLMLKRAVSTLQTTTSSQLFWARKMYHETVLKLGRKSTGTGIYHVK